VAVVIAAAAAVVQQTAAYAAERERLGACLQRLQDGVTKARAAGRKLSEFRQELVRIEAEHDRIRALVPEALRRDEYVKTVGARAEHAGVEVKTLRYVEDTTVSPNRAELSITLTGPPDAIERFAASVPTFAPASTWKEQSRSGDTATGILRTYALEMARPSDPLRCQLETGRVVWLWPHTKVIRSLRQEIGRLSTEAVALEPIRIEVDRYERVRSSLDRRLAMLKTLTEATP
jgi:hypothetical protein